MSLAITRLGYDSILQSHNPLQFCRFALYNACTISPCLIAALIDGQYFFSIPVWNAGYIIYMKNFLRTDLGDYYQAIPFEEMAKLAPAPRQVLSGMGCKPWFDGQGGIALQFLKHCLRMSDAGLIERINTDWALQYFCRIQLNREETIGDKNLVGTWRKYLGQYLDIGEWQKLLAKAWKAYRKETTASNQDATCYESYIEYPTHAKLVWNGCHELHLLLQQIRRENGLRKSRNNYDKHKKMYLSFQKRRKKIASGRKENPKKNC